VKQQWPHHHGTATLHVAGNGCLMLFPILDLTRIQAAVFMCARKHTQRAVGLIGVVQMQTQSQHIFQHLDRRLHVMNARLDGPRTISFNVNSLSNSDREVLMPRYLPIRIAMFIEINTSNDASPTAENRSHKVSAGRTLRHLPRRGHNIQKIPNPKSLPRALARAVQPDICESVLKERNRLRIYYVVENCKSEVRNVIQIGVEGFHDAHKSFSEHARAANIFCHSRALEGTTPHRLREVMPTTPC
jgi:hypothetical protein